MKRARSRSGREAAEAKQTSAGGEAGEGPERSEPTSRGPERSELQTRIIERLF